MKNLRNIKTKKGDIIYFADGRTVAVNDWSEIYFNYEELEDRGDKIIKIERPVKYATIYEAPKQILDKEEKEYLENVIRPYRHQVVEIFKKGASLGQEYIKIDYDNGKVYSSFELPYFDKNTMYKGMKLDKNYTVKELGLFEGE